MFTDIEGSTKLWEDDAPAIQAALAHHDELLKSSIEDHGGYVFKTVGDAFCCAFPTAPDALEAALETQHRLLSTRWEETGPLRVRMALHMGTPGERGGDCDEVYDVEVIVPANLGKLWSRPSMRWWSVAE